MKTVIDEAYLLGDEALRVVPEALGEELLALALHGVGDYALAVAREGSIGGLRCIGEVREGPGRLLRGAQGEREREPEAFEPLR